MAQITEHHLAVLAHDDHLADLLEALDDLHTAASEGRLASTTAMSKRELLALLRDVVYIAEETMQEIQTQSAHREPVLFIVEKPSDNRQAAG
jgi:hypothetical protein